MDALAVHGATLPRRTTGRKFPSTGEFGRGKGRGMVHYWAEVPGRWQPGESLAWTTAPSLLITAFAFAEMQVHEWQHPQSSRVVASVVQKSKLHTMQFFGSIV